MAAYLFAQVLFGAIGFGAFIYGRKQGRPAPALLGVVLMAYPYFFEDPWLLYGIGAVLTAMLWVFRE